MDLPLHTTPHILAPHSLVGSPPVAPIRPPKPAHLSVRRHVVRHRQSKPQPEVIHTPFKNDFQALQVNGLNAGSGSGGAAYPKMPRWSLSSHASSRTSVTSVEEHDEVCASSRGQEYERGMRDASIELLSTIIGNRRVDGSKDLKTIYIDPDIESTNGLVEPAADSSSSPLSTDFSTVRAFVHAVQHPYLDDFPPPPLDEHPTRRSSSSPTSHLHLPPNPRKALTLHRFLGRTDFGELSFEKGERLCIEVEDLGGGWSLGYKEAEGEEGRGLVPRGWFGYVLEKENVAVEEGGRGAKRDSFREEDSGSCMFDDGSSRSGEDREGSAKIDTVGQDHQALERVSNSSPRLQVAVSLSDPVEAHDVTDSPQSVQGNGSGTAGSKMPAQAEQEAQEWTDDAPDLLPEEEGPSFEVSASTQALADNSYVEPDQVEQSSYIDPCSLSLSRSSQRELLPSVKDLASSLPSPDPSPLTPSPLVPKTRTDVQVLDWILYGEEDPERASDPGDETQLFHIESGPAWRDTSPDLLIRVHDPETIRPAQASAHTFYSITTEFSLDPKSCKEGGTPPPITVTRRFSHFVHLHSLLCTTFPILVIPDLPSRAYAPRFEVEFIESRCRDLQRWIGRVVRHSVLKATNELGGFLMIESEGELEHLLLSAIVPAVPAPSFFSRVYHPEYNIDMDEARETIERFELHVKAVEVGNGVKGVEVGLGRVREALFGTAQTQSTLGQSLVRLVAGRALPSPSQDPTSFQTKSDSSTTSSNQRAKQWCVQTEQGAFSWKEITENESLSMTKAVQATGEAMKAVAEVWEGSAQDALLKQQEMLNELSHPHTQYLPLIETHKLVILEHERLSCLIERGFDERYHDCLSRCETILNITCAEFERIHIERREDLKEVAKGMLEDQIARYEEGLHHLRFAQAHFDPTQAYAALALTGPRLVSRLENDHITPVNGSSLIGKLKEPSSYTGMPSASSSTQGGSVLMMPIGMVAGVVASVTRIRKPTGLHRSNTTEHPYRREGCDEDREGSNTKTWTRSLFMGTIGRG